MPLGPLGVSWGSLGVSGCLPGASECFQNCYFHTDSNPKVGVWCTPLDTLSKLACDVEPYLKQLKNTMMQT